MHLLCCMLVSLKQHYALVMLHVCVFEATLCILSHRLELQYAYPFSPIPEEKICSVSGNTFFVDLGKVLPDTVQIFSSGTGEKYGSSSLWPMILDELHAYVFCGNICFSDLYFSA